MLIRRLKSWLQWAIQRCISFLDNEEYPSGMVQCIGWSPSEDGACGFYRLCIHRLYLGAVVKSPSPFFMTFDVPLSLPEPACSSEARLTTFCDQPSTISDDTVKSMRASSLEILTRYSDSTFRQTIRATLTKKS